MHRLRLQQEMTCCRTTSKFSKHSINIKLNTSILPSLPFSHAQDRLQRRIDFKAGSTSRRTPPSLKHRINFNTQDQHRRPTHQDASTDDSSIKSHQEFTDETATMRHRFVTRLPTSQHRRGATSLARPIWSRLDANDNTFSCGSTKARCHLWLVLHPLPIGSFGDCRFSVDATRSFSRRRSGRVSHRPRL